ncbi:MAG: universal stress protein [Beijerinckiaceae bacterium]|nr:universal stress protein [Beijerinckiaceae bacterium]
MVMRCILIPVGVGIEAKHRFDTAAKLAETFNSRIEVMFVSPVPETYLSGLPDVAIAAGVTFDSIKAEIQNGAAISKTKLASWCAANGIDFEPAAEKRDSRFAVWTEEVGDLESCVALAGRVSDLVVVDKPKIDETFTQRVFEASVFSAGRPTLMVPEAVNGDPLRHVAIAWNGSLESARVIGQSIALLHKAGRVSIIQAPGPDEGNTEVADLSAYLGWHGIAAESHDLRSATDKSAGELILDEAARHDASMLVMGAYTHSRLRQFLLGGVTQHVVTHARIPVLMTH